MRVRSKNSELETALQESSPRVREAFCRYLESRDPSYALSYSRGIAGIGGLFGARHVPTHGLYLMIVNNGVTHVELGEDGFAADQAAIGLDWSAVKTKVKERWAAKAHGEG